MLTGKMDLLAVLTAIANPQRLRVVAELSDGRVHVSELARRLGISRPLLYMHLDRLEKAGLVTGHLELSEDGKAMKYFQLAPFELRLNPESITAAVRSSAANGGAANGGAANDGAADDGAADGTTDDKTANQAAAGSTGTKTPDTKENDR